MVGIPKAWLDELNDQFALIADPEGRSAVLDEMAYAAHRRQAVTEAELVEMLELSEAGKTWALVEFGTFSPAPIMNDQEKGGSISES